MLGCSSGHRTRVECGVLLLRKAGSGILLSRVVEQWPQVQWSVYQVVSQERV